jgi:hypothetical protein
MFIQGPSQKENCKMQIAKLDDRVKGFDELPISIHPETPSPRAGEGQGEGDKNEISQYRGALSPPLSLPHRGGGEDGVSG